MSEQAGSAGVKALFFSYFAFVGVTAPYLSLYFADRGFAVAQIGVLMTVPQVLRIIGPPFWGWLADRSDRRGRLLRVSAGAVVLLAALLPLASASGYAGALALIALLYFMTSAQMPIGEAMALEHAAGDFGRYGRMRLWGSIGFIVAVAAMGGVLDLTGVGTLPLWMTALGVGLFAATWRLGAAPALRTRGTGVGTMRLRLREARIQWFFAANFLMIVAHMGLYIFYSLYLAQLGYSKTAIGLLWALGVLAEIALFQTQRPLFERFGTSALLAASIGVAALRFAMIGFSAGWLPVLVLAQLLHAVTFGLHHSAAMSRLHEWFEPSRQARVQALYVTLSYGCGGTVGGVLASALWIRISPAAAFIGCALVALLGWAAALASAQYDRDGARDVRVESGG